MATLGILGDFRGPGVFTQVAFGTGASLSGGGSRKILIIDQKTSAGAWTANSLQTGVKKESAVVAGAGPGSAIHRQWLAITRANKGVDVDILVVAPTTGAGIASAISTFTFAGTATTSGRVRAQVAEEREIDAVFVAGDDYADVAGILRGKVNGMPHLPVTASGSSGAFTLTAKNGGTRWGDGTYARVPISITIEGSGITVSGGGDLGATTPGADGATTETAQIEAALATIGSLRRYYVVYGDAHNSTAVAALRSFIANSAVAKQGRRMKLITGSRHTKAAVTAVAITANYERQDICHQAGSYWTPEMLAGQLAGTLQLKQDTDAAYGFVNYSGPDWLVPEAPAASRPDPDDISDLINDGVTTIASKDSGGSMLSMYVTTRSKDSSGTYDNFNACEGHRISAIDYVVDDLEPKLAVFIGKKLGTRPLVNGQPDLNYAFPKGAFDEYVARKTYVNAFNQWDNILLKDVATSLASLSIDRVSTNAGALIATVTLYAVDICSQMQNDISEGSEA